MTTSVIEIQGTLREDGTLLLDEKLNLPPGRVKVTVQAILPTTSVIGRRRGLIQWKGSQADLDQLILSADNDPLEAP
jgi:hypothetical protein